MDLLSGVAVRMGDRPDHYGADGYGRQKGYPWQIGAAMLAGVWYVGALLDIGTEDDAQMD